jgi:DNA-binding transcriptional LysR family regulator
MRLFRRVVERQSFAAAARDLRVSTAVASKRVAALEEALGTRLLQRTTRRVSATAPGVAYYEHCVRVLDDIEQTEASLGRSATLPAGLVRLSVPLSFGLMHISPLLPTLLERYPELALDVSFDDRFVDLVEERVDVALRIARSLPDSASLVSQRLAFASHVLCASPAYLERHGAPRSPADLERHACIAYGLSSAPARWSFEATRGVVDVAVRGRLVLGNSLAVRDAALAGAGIAMLPAFYLQAELTGGRLIALLPGYRTARVAVSALYAKTKTVAPKVRAVVDFLRQHLSAAPWAERKAAR